MEYKSLFDVVISVAADPDDRLKYLVTVIDRLKNELMGDSLGFDSHAEALNLSRAAIEAFARGLPTSS